MESEQLTIYHNPKCSKSRETLLLLEQNQQSLNIIEYLDSPPTQRELENIINLLGITPRELLRTGEPAYVEAGLDDQTKSDADILRAICQYPVLLERPIVICEDKAVIGRPPVRVLDIISTGLK